MHLANFSSVSKIYEAANENLKQVFAQLTPAIPTMPVEHVNTGMVEAFAHLKELRDLALQQHAGDVIIDEANILHDINKLLTCGQCSEEGWPEEYDNQAKLIKSQADSIHISAIIAMHHIKTTGTMQMKAAALNTAAMCIKLIMNLPE